MTIGTFYGRVALADLPCLNRPLASLFDVHRQRIAGYPKNPPPESPTPDLPDRAEVQIYRLISVLATLSRDGLGPPHPARAQDNRMGRPLPLRPGSDKRSQNQARADLRGAWSFAVVREMGDYPEWCRNQGRGFREHLDPQDFAFLVTVAFVPTNRQSTSWWAQKNRPKRGGV